MVLEPTRRNPVRVPVRNAVITRGDDVTLQIRVLDRDGLPLDIMASVVTASIQRDRSTDGCWFAHEGYGASGGALDYGDGYWPYQLETVWQGEAETVDACCGRADVILPRDVTAAWHGRYTLTVGLDDPDCGVSVVTGTFDVRDGPTVARAGLPGSVRISDGVPINGAMQFLVTLDQPTMRRVVVRWHTEDVAADPDHGFGASLAGYHYETGAGELRFAAGETLLMVSVPLIRHDTDNRRVRFNVRLRAVAGAALVRDAAVGIVPGWVGILDDVDVAGPPAAFVPGLVGIGPDLPPYVPPTTPDDGSDTGGDTGGDTGAGDGTGGDTGSGGSTGGGGTGTDPGDTGTGNGSTTPVPDLGVIGIVDAPGASRPRPPSVALFGGMAVVEVVVAPPADLGTIGVIDSAGATPPPAPTVALLGQMGAITAADPVPTPDSPPSDPAPNLGTIGVVDAFGAVVPPPPTVALFDTMGAGPDVPDAGVGGDTGSPGGDIGPAPDLGGIGVIDPAGATLPVPPSVALFGILGVVPPPVGNDTGGNTTPAPDLGTIAIIDPAGTPLPPLPTGALLDGVSIIDQADPPPTDSGTMPAPDPTPSPDPTAAPDPTPIPDPPPPTVQAKSLAGVYVGQHYDAFQAFETYVGKPMDILNVHTDGQSDWGHIANPVYFTDFWRPSGRPVHWSVPMMPLTGYTLGDIASGAHDADFRQAAGVYATYEPKAPGGVQYVRLGWEMNIPGFPWQVGKNTDNTAANFIAAFRRIVAAFRSVSDEFRFVWCPNSGNSPPDPVTLYPGDDVVDVIAQDSYQNSVYGLGAFSGQLVNNGRGVSWGYDFAQCRNGARVGQPKPYGISEWGVAGNDSDDSGAQFVRDLHDWIAGKDQGGVVRQVAFACYWDGGSDTPYNSKIEGDAHPQTGAAYRATFGGPGLILPATGASA